jgi:hypothetical protein
VLADQVSIPEIACLTLISDFYESVTRDEIMATNFVAQQAACSTTENLGREKIWLWSIAANPIVY